MQLTTSEIKELIIELEAKYPVEKWMIRNIHVWPLIRISLYIDLFYIDRKAKKDSSEKRLPFFVSVALGKLKGLIWYVYARFKDREHNADVDRLYDVVFLTYTIHRTLLIGFWFDQYCDPFVEALRGLKMRSLVLEMSSHNSKFRFPRFEYSKCIQSVLDYIYIKNRLFNRVVYQEGESLTGFSDFIDHIRSKGLKVRIPTLKRLRRDIGFIIEVSSYFKRLFKVTKPSIAFVADYYSLVGFAYNLACREVGIMSVDIQHGVQGEDHLAYGCWTRLPDSGYKLLPSIFWCWSEYEFKTIEEWAKNNRKNHQPYVGSNLWLNRWRNEKSELVRYYDERLRRLKANPEKSVYILFTPSMYSDLQEWIVEAIRLSPHNYQWWLRLHPSMQLYRNRIQCKLKKYSSLDVEIDLVTDPPFIAVLKHADVNITAFSSTVVEAAHWGIPSVITDPTGITLFPEQIASGVAITAYSTKELLDAIKNQADRKKSLGTKDMACSFDNQRILRKFLTTKNIIGEHHQIVEEHNERYHER